MSKANESSADFIVIGAGIIGTSIAFHLANRRAGRIVVIDKEHVAKGEMVLSSDTNALHLPRRGAACGEER
jgi:glycine/D-amino acid oxidase-like deaminating enzyme